MDAEVKECFDHIEGMVAQLITNVGKIHRMISDGSAKQREEMHAICDQLRTEMHGIRDDLQTEMRGIRSQLEEKIDSLWEKVNDLQGTVDSLRGDVKRLEERMEFAWREAIYQHGETARRVNRLEEKVFFVREEGPGESEDTE